MAIKTNVDHAIAQGLARYVDYFNQLRHSHLIDQLDTLLTEETEWLAYLEIRAAKAIEHLGLSEREIENIIASNRGGESGIHGFIAEYAEMGITNSRQAYAGMKELVTVLNDNGRADLLGGQDEIQMKFYQNLSNELKKAAEYPELKMMYPKDHIDVFQKVMAGEKYVEYDGNSLSVNQITIIKKLIENESEIRGESPEHWMKASTLNYDEVQKNTIESTLNREKEGISGNFSTDKQEVQDNVNQERKQAHKESLPSMAGAHKAAGIGAVFQGGLNFGVYVFQKHKEGKELWQFDTEDWQDGGLTFSKGAVKGGITGYGIYALTNVCHLGAPSAGAILSGTFGLINASVQYRSGVIDADGLIELATLNAIDATGAAVGAAIGQAIIPIPVVGTVIGSIISSTNLSLGKDFLNKKELELISQYQAKNDNYIEKLAKEYLTKYKELMAKYQLLGELQHTALFI